MVRVLDNQGQVTSTLLIGFYSKVRSNGIRYLRPVLPKGDYTVELEVTGEQSVWYDKSKNRFGSDDYFVTVRDILVMK
ncbi:hypothetical protein ACFSKL_08120 [Belliella marina]|uniref:Uncharacterized protein n=1 Tax=Belliella marina TaxID=1644146 RepID=A0ABW4VL68_9BACT